MHRNIGKAFKSNSDDYKDDHDRQSSYVSNNNSCNAHSYHTDCVPSFSPTLFSLHFCSTMNMMKAWVEIDDLLRSSR